MRRQFQGAWRNRKSLELGGNPGLRSLSSGVRSFVESRLQQTPLGCLKQPGLCSAKGCSYLKYPDK